MSEAQNPSSPVKLSIINTANREHRSGVLEQKGLSTSDDFVKGHLNVPAQCKVFSTKAVIKNVGRVKRGSATTRMLYCNISEDKLVFYDHHASPLAHHPIGEFKDKPDFIAVKETLAKSANYQKTLKDNYHKVPWHHVESVGEWKGKTRDGLPQSAVYVGCLNQARPDKPGVYALSISSRDYQVIWSDAGGHPSSALHSWDDLEALVGYVYSLYRPPYKHVTVDSIIGRSPLAVGETHLDPPLWDITFEGKTHTRCEVIFVGETWTRMTWVARSEHETVIKDSYISDLRTWQEAKLVDLLHRNGYVEGWVQLSASGNVKNGEDSIKTAGGEITRTKTRSVMETHGEVIYACPNILHFLKVMYDVLEAHRFAVVNRRILHRDLSINNILVLPKGIPARSETGDRPKFIDEILDPSKPSDSKSYALIIDLDNGRELLPLQSLTSANNSSVDAVSEAIEGKAKVDRDLHGCSGTPLFISRSVSIGSFLEHFIRVHPIPTLSADIATNYASVHSADPYRLRNDAPERPHGVAPDEDLFNKFMEGEPLGIKYDHYPHHDAESVYWIMVAFLLRALPLSVSGDPETQKDQNNRALRPAWESLSMHEIGRDPDSRIAFVNYATKKWERILHVKFKGIGRLLRELGEQVAPEYAFSSPKPNEVHLHEAMQRIILKHIWSLAEETLQIESAFERLMRSG